MRSRIVLILIGLTLLWGMVLSRAAYLQLVPDHRLQSLEKRQFETAVTLQGRRGDVFDRNAHELAASVTTYSIFADPKMLDEPRRVARVLSRELKTPYAALEERFRNKKRRFVWLERHLNKAASTAVTEALDAEFKHQKIHGIGVVEESQRLYPNDKLLAPVLGFVGDDGNGLEGLELALNSQLQGEKKTVNLQRDARGRPLIVAGQMFNQAPEGEDIVLTIDRELQFVLEQELTQAIAQYQADSAVGVVLDAQTSEILAMGGAPTFDPNRERDYPQALKRNRVVTDPFEPGSTMKTFVIAGALERGLIEPNTKIDCQGGVLKIGKRIIREADAKHRFGNLTVSEILAYSSNVGATKIAFKMGDQALNDTLMKFGFGAKTGIDLPGESRGILQSLPWREHLLANISFGHGVAATPLQVANAYAVIANGGWLKRPYIVKSIRDRESGDVIEAKPKVLTRVLSDAAVAKMRMMLTGVTSGDGTGTNARVPGFPVAGKTGTAQKAELHGRGYGKSGYVSSFAGFLPANDPKFVIYVAVDHPRKEYYGAAVAAPVFSRLAAYAVRRAGLAPVTVEKQNVLAMDQSQPKPAVAVQPLPMPTTAAAPAVSGNRAGVLPELSGLALREVMARINSSGLKPSVRVEGDGFVARTIPGAGVSLAPGQPLTVILTK